MDWKVLEKLSNLGGVSGHEDAIHDYIHQTVNIDGIRDKLGSSLFTVGKDGISIMLAAHTDEVGFIVSKIEETGFLRVQSVGNMWPHTLLHQVVVVQTKDKKQYKGVFGGPAVHSLPKEKREKVLPLEDMYVDLGVANAQEIIDLGIEVGDMVYVYAEFQEMANSNFLMGKAIDNRISVALGIWLLERFKVEQPNNKVTVAFTVQEEVGLRGARTSTQVATPDLALAIDTTLSGDTPFNQSLVKLGQGVAISVIDSMTIMHRGLLIYLEDLCQRHNIPYQLSCFTDGGTDAGNIHKTFDGILSTTIMIPMRYMHTHYGVVHKQDVEAAYRLLCAVIEDMTSEKFEKLLEENYMYKE